MPTASQPATASARLTHGLTSPDKFFATIRPLFGTTTQAQLESIQAKLTAFAAQGLPVACQSASKKDPLSASKRAPLRRAA